MTRAATILAILLILPAAALAASDVQLEKNGQPLTHLPAANTTVEMTVSFEAHPDAYLTALTYTAPDGTQASKQVSTDSCGERCELDITTRSQQTISLTFQDDRPGGEPQTITKTLEVDEQPPAIENVTIGECTQSCVYSSQSTITITLTDTGSGVDNTSVRAQINGQTSTATCSGQDPVTCTAQLSGQADADITVTAKDRAGNTADPQTISARYDASAPAAQEPQFAGLYGLGENTIPGGSDATIELVVQEEERPSVRFESDIINQTGECARSQQEENDYVCTITINAPQGINTNVNGRVIVTDQAGNADEKPFNFRVEQSNQDIVPEYWSASAKPLKSIDARTWSVNNQDLPVQLSLNKKAPTNARPIRVNVKDCTLVGAPSNSVQVQSDATPTNGRLSTQFDLLLVAQPDAADQGESDIFTQRNITCTAEIYTSIGSTTFAQPETEEILIQPRFTRLPPPQQAMEVHLNQSQQKIQRIQKTSRTINIIYQVFQTMCVATGQVEGGAFAMMGAAAATTVLPGLAESFSNSGQAMDDFNNFFIDNFGQYCQMLTCSREPDSWYSQGTDAIGLTGDGAVASGTEYLADLGGAEDPHQLIDPYKSIFVAGTTGCLPAIVYHVDNLQALRCTEAKCLQQLPQGTTSVASCEYAQSQAMCEYFAGAVYYAIPAANVWDSALARVEQVFSNPVALVGASASAVCDAVAPGVEKVGDLPFPADIACGVTLFGERLNTYIGTANDIRNAVTQAEELFINKGNFCEGAQQGSVINRHRMPWRSDSYCNAGFVAFNQGGSRYVHANDRTCVCTRNSLPNAVGDEPAAGKLAGCDLDCSPTSVPGEVDTEAREIYDECGFTQAEDEIQNSEYYGDATEAMNTEQNLRNDKEEERGKQHEHRRNQRNLSSSAFSDMRDARPDSEEAPLGEGLSEGSYDTLRSYLNNPDAEMTDEVRAAVNEFNQFNPEAANKIYQVEEERENVEESQDRIDQLEEDIKQAREDKNEALRELRFERIQQDRSFSGISNRILTSAQTYGYIGTVSDMVFGTSLDDQPFFNDVSDAIGSARSAPEKAATQAICSQFSPPSEERAIIDSAGRSSAYISAASTQSGDGYQYAINAYVQLPNPVEGEATVRLESPGQQRVETFSLAQGLTRTGANALPFTSNQRYERACIIFGQPIGNLYTVDPVGINPDNNYLCADIQEESR